MFVQINEKPNSISDMKKLFSLSILIPLAMICSCQKQDATAEQQLAQRKVELDAREKALDEREKALSEREKLVARAPLPSDLQLRGLKRDNSAKVPPSSLPPGLPPDNPELKAQREKRIQDRVALRQRRLEAIQKMRTLGAEASPGAEASAPPAEASSPTPSPAPQQ